MKPLLFVCIIAASLMGCSTVHKLFNKNKTTTDSLYSHKQKVDSAATFDSLSLHKESGTAFTQSDSSKTNEQTTIKEKVTTKWFDTLGRIKKQTVIKKTTEIKKSKEDGSVTEFENEGMADWIELRKAEQVSKQESDSGHVSKQAKTVTNEVRKTKSFQFLWWLLILIPAYLIVRNWKAIKSYFLFLFTGV
jgi:uncharacterized membrane protein